MFLALRLCAISLLLVPLPLFAEGASPWGDFGYLGQATSRAARIDSPTSWLAGGLGRFRLGSDDRDEADLKGLVEADLAFRWEPGLRLLAHVHIVGRSEPDSLADAVGLIEARLDLKAFPRDQDRLRLRLGHFLLPTSFENTEPLWRSPYTMTYSALNSWIGEEVRPTGLQLDYDLVLGAGHSLEAGGVAFVGNDSNGALLAWRGWTMGDRLTGLGETLPLPPLFSLEEGGPFDPQDDDGTRPFGEDLDGRWGWSGFLGWQLDDRWAVQWTHYDNRGDRDLYDGEYAWETDFDLLGFRLPIGPSVELLGELMDGRTAMGLPDPRAEIDFRALYVLASWKRDTWRFTARYDEFSTDDLDHLPTGETNDEEGRAWTAALFYERGDVFRVGLEYVALEAHRIAAAESGFDPVADGDSLSFEVRYNF